MFSTPSRVYLTIVLTALLPGAISLCLGYRLIHRTADPALPELLAAHRRKNGVMFGIAIGIAVWAAISSAGDALLPIIAGIAILYAGLVAAAYPLRRAVYQERWSFLAYCLFYPRTLFGVFGFWLGLTGLPALVAFAGEQDWLFALPLGIVLVIWHSRYSDVLRWCLRSQPLAEGDLLEGCRALAQKCDLPDVRFECIPLSGGVIANAMALPSLRGLSVLFTDTLLDRFDREEILAIAAHELAHFDHYTPAYLRRLRVGNYLLIAAGVAAGPIARAVGSEWGLFPAALWLVVVVVSLALRARGKQRQETMCDLKAVKLTGNPDAVISGLTKLYTIARMPRRLDNRTEQSATHPSLARRIRDIQKAAGSEPASLAATHTFTSADGRSTAAFDAAGLHWIDQDGVAYKLSYAHLTELRVEVKAGRSMRLVALGPSARRWELALRDADVAPVQSVLDRVDGRLADPPHPRSGLNLTLSPEIRRIVVLATVTIVLSLSQFGTALVALLAWLKPTAPMFVGAGLAALTSAAFMLRDSSDSYLAELWIPLAVLGLFFFVLAWSVRRTPRHGTRRYIIGLAAAAALSLALIVSQGLSIVDVYRSSRDVPSATVFLVALAGALFCSSERREQIGGLGAALLAGVMTSIASTPFLDRFGTDPFLVQSHPLRSVVLHASPVSMFDVPLNTSRIGLSADGQYVAVYNEPNDYRDLSGKVQVGRVGDALTAIAADDVSFVSEDRLLIVRSGRQSTVLEARTLEPSFRVLWQRVVENMLQPTLSVNQASGRWALLGWDGEDTIVRTEGPLDGSNIEEHRWPVAQDRNGSVSAMTSSGSDALVLETRFERSVVARTLPSRWTWAQLILPPRSVSHYTTISRSGRQTRPDSKLDVACAADVLPDGALACTAYDGSRTHVVMIACGSDRVQSAGFLDGRFLMDHSAVEGWLTGWIAGRPAAIHLASGVMFETPAAMRTLRFVPITGDRLAVLTFATHQLTALVYAPFTSRGRAGAPTAENRRGGRP